MFGASVITFHTDQIGAKGAFAKCGHHGKDHGFATYIHPVCERTLFCHLDKALLEMPLYTPGRIVVIQLPP